MTMDSNIVSILLDLKEQVGGLGAQMHAAARSRDRLEDSLKDVSQKLDMVDHRTDIIETQISGIATIEDDIRENVKPDILKLKLLTGKFTVVWGAGFAVIAWALSYFSTEIRSFIFGRH